jgi:tetratricopeptide (TPR) repeat protein
LFGDFLGRGGGKLIGSMKVAAFAAVLVGVPSGSHAASLQHEHHRSGAGVWTSRYDGLRHPTSTRVPEAQRLFDQGLLLIYAFNHAAAIQCFKEATALDPAFARAFWGIALAESANINAPVTADRAARAFAAIREAQRLANDLGPRDRAYIDALALRYDPDPDTPRGHLEEAYARAMKDLTARFPDDPDAHTLFADALMNLAPWDYWSKTGEPLNRAEEIVAALRAALSINPHHVGANHYFIHAIEASNDPAQGLPSALRLSSLGLDTGHLAHMPSHIHYRLGDYDAVVAENEKAVEADRAYAATGGDTARSYAGYAAHNLEFLVVGNSLRGNYEQAMRSADAFDEAIRALVARSPSVEYKLARRASVMLLFGRWEEVLALKDPGAAQPFNRAFWHYARGRALAARGKLAAARRERRAFDDARTSVPDSLGIGRSSAGEVFGIAAAELDGRISWAARQPLAAVSHLREAIRRYDAMKYDEPPNWYYPLRETLGGMLVLLGRHKEAEATFREDLALNPRNPRSLFGLAEALRAQARQDEAALVEAQFRRAWKSSDTPMTVEHLVGSGG